MDTQEYLEKIQKIENRLIEYLDRQDNIEENFQNIINILNDQKVLENRHDFRLFLHLLTCITNNHHQIQHFFDKIEKILINISSKIKEYYTNFEIFEIFKSNKRLLLFLLQNKLFYIDEDIFQLITKGKYLNYKYPEYFSPEIKPFITEQLKKKSTNNADEYSWVNYVLKNQPNDFEGKRKKGENDDYICELIRNDSIDEFISYVKKTDYPLNSEIKKSIFETNKLLNKKIKAKCDYLFYISERDSTLIEYAAFFGSSQIFKYLYKNGVDLVSVLWVFAIHGDDTEIIRILEENNVKPPNNSFKRIIKESIKCHHNHITNYIENNLTDEKFDDDDDFFNFHFHYYNFGYFSKEINNNDCLNYACKYDYYTLVKYLLQTIDIYKNENNILILIFFNSLLRLAANNNNQDIIQLLLNIKEYEWPEKCFKGCNKLTHITIPSYVTEIKYNSFGGCSSLLEITIPSSVTSIGDFVFNGCYLLKQITIQSPTIKIEPFAFNGCNSLKQVFVPSSFTGVENNVFAGATIIRA